MNEVGFGLWCVVALWFAAFVVMAFQAWCHFQNAGRSEWREPKIFDRENTGKAIGLLLAMPFLLLAAVVIGLGNLVIKGLFGRDFSGRRL